MIDENPNNLRKFLLVAIILILLSVVGFYLIFPLLGIAIIMSAGAWGIIVSTIALFSIAVLLFFILPGLLIILVTLFAFGWVIMSIILFPFLFPLVIPVFILLLFIAYLSRRKRS